MSLLQMRNICKSFSGIPVLKNVQLTVEQGEVHALLGENGAGKSTLMNVLTGVFPRDKGEIEFDGTELKNITIRQSENMGIAFVHQELNLFNDLKVYENIFLQKEYTTKLGRLDKKKMIQEAEEKNADPKIRYEVCGLETYGYPADSFDCVISNLILHYVRDLDEIYGRVYRTLKEDGVFLVNIEHPTFTAGINEDWEYDKNGNPTCWPIDNYFYPGERTTHFGQ